MKRRLLTLVAATALLLTLAPSVSAASIGACSSGSNNGYRSGETTGQLALHGVYGEAYLPPQAGACTPNDGSGINASAVQVGLSENIAGAFVTMGIIVCNHGDGSWPSSLCDGRQHVYAEHHGSTFWDYSMSDLGAITAGATKNLQISYGCSGYSTSWCWFLNGNRIKTKDMGTGLKPTMTTVNASWQMETQDPGDGLGNNVSGQSVGAGRIQYQKNSDQLWYLRSVNGACDYASSQHHCAANGSYGFYGYTTN